MLLIVVYVYLLNPLNNITSIELKDLYLPFNKYNITYSKSRIKEENWNHIWESNFDPVRINHFVGIRAHFHPHFDPPVQHEIEITPKMSFGTGHHATTAAMIELMLKENFINKTVLDFGSGTGVLAILAKKLNAKKVIAIDNEEWAYYNCIENVQRNNCADIICIHGDDNFEFTEKFDAVLANINRNVILKNISQWEKLLAAGGILMVSGILLNDEADVIAAAEKNNLAVKDILRNNGWLAISFQNF